MKTKIFNKAKGLVKAVLPFYLFTLLPLATACSDDFLEVQNPTGEPLEEYYMTDEHLAEACVSAYAPLHWPDWDGSA